MIVYIEKSQEEFLASDLDGEFHKRLSHDIVQDLLSDEQYNIFVIRGFKGFFSVNDDKLEVACQKKKK